VLFLMTFLLLSVSMSITMTMFMTAFPFRAGLNEKIRRGDSYCGRADQPCVLSQRQD
jgi:hypothetical protein